jgi:RHS repeat-associated protein
VDDVVTGSSYDTMNRLASKQPGGVLRFQGSLNEAATVRVGGTPASVSPTNTFTGTATVGSGTTNVVVEATDPSGNTRTNTYQVNQTGASTSFSYDANGNLTGDATKTYEWDAANRLVAVKQGGSTLASFVYDGLGRRVQKVAAGVTRTYLYDGEDIVEERLSSGGTVKYVHGLGIDEPLAHQDGSGAVSYYLADHLGSIVQTTNTAKTVTLTRDYDPWGNLLQGASTAGYAFTGREWDSETGLYYYRARYYDPRVGFISEDPIGFGGGVNFSSYVNNNPVNRTDPLGLAASGGGCCNQDWLGCMAKCLATYDPLGPAGNAVLTAAGGTFWKSWIGQPTLLGSSPLTTVPSAAGGAAVRGVGRFFSPIWITYGNYLFFVEVRCAAACAGWACSY